METQFFNIKEHILEAAYVREYPRATANGMEEDLQLHIKQYTPKASPVPNSKSITLIAAHANGFPKELYEPLWDDLCARLSKQGVYHIGGIWIADVAWQGQSSVLNEHALGNDPHWHDHSRDLLHMINVFRKQMPLPLIGIGHSMGGNILANLALIHPRLFASLILLDPVINLGPDFAASKGTSGPPGAKFGPAWLSTYRKDRWPSREIAANSFRNSPFYKAWDPRVLERWITYGLRDLPTATYSADGQNQDSAAPEVTLTTPRHYEIWSFLRPNYEGHGANGRPHNRATHPDVDPGSNVTYPFYRPEMSSTYFALPRLRPPTYYIMGEKSDLGSPESQFTKVPITGTGVGGSGGVKEGQVDHTYVKGVGHLIPMDAPGKSAELAAGWLEKTLPAWFEAAAEYQQSWVPLPQREKLTVDKRWTEHIGPPPGRPARKPKVKL